MAISQRHTSQARSLPNGAEIRFKSNESAGQTALASAAGVVPLRVLLPDPTVFALDDEFGLLVLRQLSSALDGVRLVNGSSTYLHVADQWRNARHQRLKSMVEESGRRSRHERSRAALL